MKLGEWIGLFCFLASLYVLWQIRQLALLAFTAVVIAIALNSLTRQVQKLGIARNFAIPIVLTITLLLATLFTLVIVPPFAEQFSLLIDLLIAGIRELPDRLNVLEEQLPGQLRFPDVNEFLNWATSPDSAVIDVFNNFFSFFNSSLQVLLQLLLVLILSLMFLGNPSAYRNGVLKLFPSFYRRRADDIMQECEVALCNWLGGILISSSFVFALSFVGLSLLGIRLVLAHALLAGILNFIPNIGPTLSIVFPAMVALLSPDPWKIIAVVVLYTIIQQIESYFLTPTVMARQVSLLPAFTLLAQIFFASVFGFLGLVLALPLAVVSKTWIQELVIKDILDGWQRGTVNSWLRPLVDAQLATPQPQPAGMITGVEEMPSEGTSEEI